MDPFNLFWKTAAGLENLFNFPVQADWDANKQRGVLHFGGVTFYLYASPEPDHVRITNDFDGSEKDIEKTLERFMIADAMEFILGELA